jgi:hypothetical protein
MDPEFRSRTRTNVNFAVSAIEKLLDSMVSDVP